ncbi:cwfJ-like family protein [Wolffia australiana]
MLSGIKFIPREQVKELSDSDHSPKDRKKSKGKKKHHTSKRSRRNASDSSDDTYSESSSFSETEEELNKRKSSKSKKGIRQSEKKKGSKDERQKEKDMEISRKEMGLDWMLKSSNVSTRRDSHVVDAVEEVPIEEEIKPNPRELNPYLRSSGAGFPEESEEHKSNLLLSSSLVGDGGASWRLKALKRAKEQASREGRKFDEVVEERWGSLGELATSVASRRAAHVHAHQHAIKDRRKGNTEKPDKLENDINQGQRGYLRDVSSRHPEMKRPKYESTEWRRKKTTVIKEDDVLTDALSAMNKFSNDGSFLDTFSTQLSHDSGNQERGGGETSTSQKDYLVSVEGLSANQLAAKAMQLRMKGKHDEADKLMEAASISQGQDSHSKAIGQEIMGSGSRHAERRAPCHWKKREDDGDHNLAKRIMQDRKYTFSGRADDEYDFDGAPSRKSRKNREPAPGSQHNSGHRMMTQQERCQFCLEGQTQQKHLVISIANFTYLMLPRYQPLVQGHCCILPLQHEASTRALDDNVWQEMRNFKKCLIMMFTKQDKGVVFIETVTGLSKQRRHCLVECIPLPRELAEEAPMYFKKAIDEAEDEWSQHNAKKLIETTSEKGLRRVIPKDFPYFFVEFGLDRGFAHVIDDESNFNTSIGLNVIRGMLQLPEEDMYRRRRHETVDTQKSAVAAFSQAWEPFDWTKQLS